MTNEIHDIELTDESTDSVAGGLQVQEYASLVAPPQVATPVASKPLTAAQFKAEIAAPGH